MNEHAKTSSFLLEDQINDYFQSHEGALLAAWAEAGGEAPNPSDYQRPAGSLEKMVRKGFRIFEGHSVLDIGCNAGLNSLAPSFIASKVIGCDHQPIYISRALAGKEFMERERDMSHVQFEVGDFSHFLTDDLNAIIACRILYHIGDEGVTNLSNFLKPRRDFRILVHTRPGRKTSRTEAFNGLIEVADIRDFLSGLGFRNFKEWGSPRQRVLVAEK